MTRVYYLLIINLFLNSNVQLFSQIQEPEMIFVEGGSYNMGGNDGDEDEKPIHEVKVNSFYIGKYEITVKQYREFCQKTGREYPKEEPWSKANHPAIYITWYNASEYCEWLSRETGKKYRLPTEAEWEYAARGGKKSKGFQYSGDENVDKAAWYQGDVPEDGTQPVGSLVPNELGIFDMSGNVWEWCSDRYADDYYNQANNNENPGGPKIGNWRVVRGGSWADKGDHSRVSYRQSNIPINAGFNDGFRIVRVD